MTPTAAAQLLDLPADASPEQLEARFLELRRRLEDKIAKAPTPGLQAKYRESLAEITTAFETLTLAADSSSLPVTQKQGSGSREQGAQSSHSAEARPGLAPSSQLRAPSSARQKSGGKEFALVAIIAVVVLAGGGWFVLKTRAENAEAQAEKDRQAATAKAEQEHLAQVARLEAEEKKKVEEAERTRQEKLLAQLRGDLAEARIAWEAVEREERNAERRLAELKSDLRNMRDQPAGKVAEAQAMAAAQQDYYTWISDTLARHPAKIARGRAEEMLSARQADDAKAALQEFSTALRALETEIPRQRQALLDLDGELTIQTNPEAKWTLTDAFGQVHRGQGPAQLKEVAVGSAQLAITAQPWGERRSTVLISRSKPVTLDAGFRGAPLQLASDPAGATVTDQNGRTLGVTPLTVPDLSPMPHRFTLTKPEFHPQQVEIAMTGEPASRTIKLRAFGSGLALPAKWRWPARLRVESITTSTGSINYQTSSVEEWDFSAPDATGDWTQIERHLVSLRSTGLPTTAQSGSLIRYQRKTDGTWESRFVRGGVTDQAYARAYGVFSWTPAMFELAKCWPPDSVNVGGTWPVKVSDIPLGALPNASGQATGKLLSLDRQQNSDWAELEISFDLEWHGDGSAKIPLKGRNRYRVNLSEGYVSEYDTQTQNSGADTRSTMRISLR